MDRGKKRRNRRIYERPVARDSSKIEAIPVVGDSLNGRTTRHVPLVALRAIAVQIARGTFIPFTLITKYGVPANVRNR